MSDKIQVEYDTLEEIAKILLQQADEIEAMRRQLTYRYGDLRDGGWIGGGADAFFDEMHGEVLPAWRRLEDALDKACFTTRQMIELFYSAEIDSAEQFDNLV